jgi:two-component system alkaline phosphatase synthesis response regulator PhoP
VSDTDGGHPPRARILLVEDEPALVLTLTDRLRAERYEVDAVSEGEVALASLGRVSYDLVLLDLMLQGIDGYEVCRQLRARGLTVPVLMLTARAQVVDRVVGLKLGADDYLVKPFDMTELLARVEALLRRGRPAGGGREGTYAFGGVDFRRAEVVRAGHTVALSGMEFKLLAYFIEHRGALLSRNELLDKVWGYDALPQSRTVDVHVGALRQKLERVPAHPEHIVTVHRQGYRFTG